MELTQELARIHAWLKSNDSQWTTIELTVRQAEAETQKSERGTLRLVRDSKEMKISLGVRQKGLLEVITFHGSPQDFQVITSHRHVTNTEQVGALVIPLIRDFYGLNVPTL